MMKSHKEHEDKFLDLIEKTALLPASEQRRMWECIKALVVKPSPLEAMRNLRASASESSEHMLYPALARPNKRKSKEKAHDTCLKILDFIFDDDLSKQMRKDLFIVIRKYFPLWKIWFAGPVPKKRGRPTASDRDYYIGELVDIFTKYAGKQLSGRKFVAEILDDIKYLEKYAGRKLVIGSGSENVRRIYEKKSVRTRSIR